MNTKTITTTTDASAKDKRFVQGIEDDNGGCSGSTTGSVDWKQQHSVVFPCSKSSYGLICTEVFFIVFVDIFLFIGRSTVN